MPSDAKKKQQQKKKEAAKARQAGKKPQSNNQTKATDDSKEQSPTLGDLQNGTNGTAISAEGRFGRLCYFLSLKNFNMLSYLSHFLDTLE